MDYQQITCKATGKTLKAEQIYKIRNDENCIENIVSICNSCPYANSQNLSCQNCYGTIVQNSVRQINVDTGRIKMEFTNYRNTFLELNDEYILNMSADEFLQTIDIVANLNHANWNHGQKINDKLRAYMPPNTWKTDCKNCKLRCKNNNIIPACEKAKQYVEENYNMNIENMTTEQIAKVNLPQNCICQNQVQRMIEV